MKRIEITELWWNQNKEQADRALLVLLSSLKVSVDYDTVTLSLVTDKCNANMHIPKVVWVAMIDWHTKKQDRYFEDCQAGVYCVENDFEGDKELSECGWGICLSRCLDKDGYPNDESPDDYEVTISASIWSDLEQSSTSLSIQNGDFKRIIEWCLEDVVDANVLSEV